MPRHRTYTDEEVRQAVASSRSYAQALRQLGLSPKGGNYATLKKLISQLGLCTTHMTGRGWLRGRTHDFGRGRPLDELLVRDSPATDNRDLKRRLVRGGLLVYACATCGISEWCGEKLVLHLDHVDGDRRNNELTNLRLLCPNCHSQTPTYCGRAEHRTEPHGRIEVVYANSTTRPCC